MDNIYLKILLVDDEKIVHQTIGDYLKDLGHEVTGALDASEALTKIERDEFNLALIDVRMPGMDGLSLFQKLQNISPDLSVVIITGHGSMETAVTSLRLGASDFLTKPIKLLELDAVLEKSKHIEKLKLEKKQLKETIRGIQSSQDARSRNRSIIATSPQMKSVIRQIHDLAEMKCDTVLITGETGTGKEVVAREIHFKGSGDDKPFIAVSCPAITDTLFESELFGHMKGSFTGAIVDKPGSFELANNGTLFLDEIADFSPPAQAKILRAIETRAVRRVGGAKEKTVNVRIVTATNVSLENLVEEGKFRRDLFYRLNTHTIHLAPLRERRKDIIPLAGHFLELFKGRKGLKITGFGETALRKLESYSYPGNARELRNIVERAAVLCRQGIVEEEHLNLPAEKIVVATASPEKIPDDERSSIINALNEYKWNRKLAAQALDMPYSTFRYKLKKLNIE